MGTEGLLGVAVEITLRLLPRPEAYHTVLAAYPSLEAAGEAVSRVIRAGLLPGAMEIMDRLSIEAAEKAVRAGYPLVEGLLIVELEGPKEEVAAEAEVLHRVLEESGALELRVARDEAERQAIWKGRKAPSAPWGGFPPTTWSKTAWCPAPASGRPCGRSGASPGSTA